MKESAHAKLKLILTDEALKTLDEARDQYIISEFKETEIQSDTLNSLKEVTKKLLGNFYWKITRLVSPVYGPDELKDVLKENASGESIVVNLGSGTTVYPNVIAVDGSPYDNVDVVCDLRSLPFKDNSVDVVASVAVLEHVSDPEEHVREMERVLKPGGEVRCFIPFLQPYHASPHDYQRYTESGMAHLFRDFEVEHVTVGAGPTSSLIWILGEWLAIVFSFGSMRLYRLLQPLTLLLSPLKFLDYFLTRHPAAHIAASGFWVKGIKRS